MTGISLIIEPFTYRSSQDDVRACASFINRRHQFEPNRLQDHSRSEESRLAEKAYSIQTFIRQPQSTAFLARLADTGEVVGWIAWTEPPASKGPDSYRTEAKANGVEAPLDAIDGMDREKDLEAVEAVSKRKKEIQKRFFGDDPVWVLNYLFAAPHIRRSGIASQLVQAFLSYLKAHDPGAKVGFTSSPMARSLYEKCGFTLVEWLDFTFDDIDTEGKAYKHRTRFPYMSNYYAVEEAEAVKSVQHRKAYNGPAEQDIE